MYEQYTLSKTKIALCALALSVMFIAYDHFVHQASAQNEEASATVQVDSISIVNRVQALKLDKSILDDEVFNSLEDFSQELTPEDIGRSNPFAPLSGAANSPRTQTRGR
jgi:hypothetical protein